MSAGQFRDVDPDLLADFVGGALAGTPEEARVARLIAEEPAWARAHEALVAATHAVRADLAAWGATPEPMPPEVTARLTAALTMPERAGDHVGRRVPVARAPEGPAETAPAAARPGATGGPPARPGATDRPAGVRPGRARRRWRRWAAPAALAVGVAALAALGVGQLTPGGGADSTATRGESESAPAVASAGSPGAELPAPVPARVTSSGRDYSIATLPVGADAAGPDDSPRPMAAGGEPGHPSPAAAPPALRPLTEPTALAACLRAVATAHGGGPLVVDLVDFAAFQGSPALVVAFTDAADERWVWVAGPGCGRSGTGPDTRYVTRVG